MVTMSMGVAMSACLGKAEVEALLNQADASLYAAKENGPNRIEHFTPALQQTKSARVKNK